MRVFKEEEEEEECFIDLNCTYIVYRHYNIQSTQLKINIYKVKIEWFYQ